MPFFPVLGLILVAGIVPISLTLNSLPNLDFISATEMFFTKLLSNKSLTNLAYSLEANVFLPFTSLNSNFLDSVSKALTMLSTDSPLLSIVPIVDLVFSFI